MSTISADRHQPFDGRQIWSLQQVRDFISAHRPLTMVSADSHAACPRQDVFDYVDPQYRYLRDDYIDFMRVRDDSISALGYPFPPKLLEVIDPQGKVSAGGELGYFDPARRLRETEADGVVAEIIIPDGPLALVPLFSHAYKKETPEHRAAGARAHNRFMVEFCAHAPRRLVRAQLVYPWPDMAAAARSVEDGAANDAKAIYAPPHAGVDGDPCPSFTDPIWDPVWAACEETSLPLYIHAAFGQEQGETGALIKEHEELAASEGKSLLSIGLDRFAERRPLWQLMWAGVFDRFPNLKVVFAEVRCDWVRGTLDFLDEFAAKSGSHMKCTPSEYWQRHCSAVATPAKYSDIAARHEIGVTKVMFGTDYPDVEGAWPNTHDYIRATMADVPEPEARAILGENAIDLFGLDRPFLEAEALRCGPMPWDVLGDQVVDPEILTHFQYRFGIGDPVNLHMDELVEAVDRDTREALELMRLR
jgi:predicted TIM-barrel fold metal-dependent hydrolase